MMQAVSNASLKGPYKANNKRPVFASAHSQLPSGPLKSAQNHIFAKRRVALALKEELDNKTLKTDAEILHARALNGSAAAADQLKTLLLQDPSLAQGRVNIVNPDNPANLTQKQQQALALSKTSCRPEVERRLYNKKEAPSVEQLSKAITEGKVKGGIAYVTRNVRMPDEDDLPKFSQVVMAVPLTKMQLRISKSVAHAKSVKNKIRSERLFSMGFFQFGWDDTIKITTDSCVNVTREAFTNPGTSIAQTFGVILANVVVEETLKNWTGGLNFGLFEVACKLSAVHASGEKINPVVMLPALMMHVVLDKFNFVTRVLVHSAFNFLVVALLRKGSAACVSFVLSKVAFCFSKCTKTTIFASVASVVALAIFLFKTQTGAAVKTARLVEKVSCGNAVPEVVKAAIVPFVASVDGVRIPWRNGNVHPIGVMLIEVLGEECF
jgi:hypothetical protein